MRFSGSLLRLLGRVIPLRQPDNSGTGLPTVLSTTSRPSQVGRRHRRSHLDRPYMRLSRYFLPILRETPKEAEIVSHRLMLRAGMMRQEAAGIYAFLPLGLGVLKEAERIVRGGQDRSGAIGC